MGLFYLLDHSRREEARLDVQRELLHRLEELREVFVQPAREDLGDAAVLKAGEDLVRAAQRLARVRVLDVAQRLAHLLQAETQAPRDVVAQDEELRELERRDHVAVDL